MAGFRTAKRWVERRQLGRKAATAAFTNKRLLMLDRRPEAVRPLFYPSRSLKSTRLTANCLPSECQQRRHPAMAICFDPAEPPPLFCKRALAGWGFGGEARSVHTSFLPMARHSSRSVSGATQKALKRHLGSAHGMTPGDYRAAWNLPSDYPMVAPDYKAKRIEIAKRLGLVRKAAQ